MSEGRFKKLKKEIEKTQLLIFAGGSGKRMGKIEKPKVLLELNKKTLLDVEIEYYLRWGFKRFVFLLGYKAKEVLKHLEQKWPELKFEYTIDPTTKNWGKGKALKYAMEQGIAKKMRSLITFPDDLKLDPDLPVKLISQHIYGIEHFSTLATVVFVPAMPYPFGVAKIEPNGIVTEFEEKPLISMLSNIGVEMIEPAVFDYVAELIDLKAPKAIEFEAVVLHKLAEERKVFSLIIPYGSWLPVNDFKAYEKACSMF